MCSSCSEILCRVSNFKDLLAVISTLPLSFMCSTFSSVFPCRLFDYSATLAWNIPFWKKPNSLLCYVKIPHTKKGTTSVPSCTFRKKNYNLIKGFWSSSEIQIHYFKLLSRNQLEIFLLKAGILIFVFEEFEVIKVRRYWGNQIYLSLFIFASLSKTSWWTLRHIESAS